MAESNDYEELFLQHLPFIDRAAAGAAQVVGLRGDDVEEFVSWAREQLWEDGYALVRKWRGQSKITTYLATVIMNLGREYRVKLWGRWRPSAAAVRLGSLAVRLETLIYRDGWQIGEAAEMLRSRGETMLSVREVADLVAKIPPRVRRPRTQPVDQPVARNDADVRVDESEDDAERKAVHLALTSALSELEPAAQVILRMHFLEGRSLADIARALCIQQKPLYRVKDAALRSLRDRLATAGITWDSLSNLIGGDIESEGLPEQGRESQPSHLSTNLEIVRDNPASRPSNEQVRSNPPDDTPDQGPSAGSPRYA